MPLMVEQPSFSAKPEEVGFAGLLFDFDGTLLDTTAAVVKHWQKQAKILGVDPNEILATSHGRRSIDVLRFYNPALANWEYIKRIESAIPKQWSEDGKVIPGAPDLLSSLDQAAAPWAIVTSGTLPHVLGWLDVMKLAHPKNIVVADDVENGKPDPEGYRLGQTRLRLPHGAPVLVFEDAPAGIKAGKAAGFKVVGLATSHTYEQVRDAGADWVVRDMQSITLSSWNAATARGKVMIRDALIQ